jgi:hypothetical protein
MPADALVADAMATVTNAVTIDAPTARVWPWLAQLGSGRAGWYSYDQVDNGGRASAWRIVPELQLLSAGDAVPALPEAIEAFLVQSAVPASHLVLASRDRGAGPALSWEYLLSPLGLGRTRLIVRGRVSPRWLDPGAHPVLARLPRPLLLLAARVGHRLMLARHLRGLKRRAERPDGPSGRSAWYGWLMARTPRIP